MLVENDTVNGVGTQAGQLILEVTDKLSTNGSVKVSSRRFEYTIRIGLVGLDNTIRPGMIFGISHDSRDIVFDVVAIFHYEVKLSAAIHLTRSRLCIRAYLKTKKCPKDCYVLY